MLQARVLEWFAISFSNVWKWKVKGKLLSRVRLLATPWTAAYQAPPSTGFSRQEYWSGVPPNPNFTIPSPNPFVLSIIHKFIYLLSPLVTFWTIKKGEHWRIDAFELWCWRRVFRVPWIVRRSKQSILKEISAEYSLEGLMLKLKLQYFGHLNWRTDSFEKTLMLGKIEGKRRRGWQRMSWLDDITNSMDMSLSSSGRWWRTGKPDVLQSMGTHRVGQDWVTEKQLVTS